MKKLFQSIGKFFSRVFGKAYDAIKKNSEVAVRVTQELKKWVESPIATIAVNLIPGDLDNAILGKLRKGVPVVTAQVAIAHNIVQTTVNPNQTVEKLIEYLRSLNPQARAKFWVDFAAELNIALSDGKLTYNETVLLTQMAYNELFAKK